MRFGSAVPRPFSALDLALDPGAAVAGVAEGAANVEAANIQEKGQLALAQEQADAQAKLEQQAFNNQVNYINSNEEAIRKAISGVTSEGNPYYEAENQRAAPAFAGGGTFGPTSTPSEESGSDTSSYSDPVVRGLIGQTNGASGSGGSSPTGTLGPGATGMPAAGSGQTGAPVFARNPDPVAQGIGGQLTPQAQKPVKTGLVAA